MSEKNSYSDTLNLPRTDFPMRGNLPAWEPEQLAAWQELDLFSRLKAKGEGKPVFLLHDGPPYANGDIHIGTALNKTLKDVVCRFATMRGFNSPYVPGWDTHGMPIEHAAIRSLKLKLNEIDPLELRLKCEEWALGWVDKQREAFKRLGIIGDWQNPYITLYKEYEAAQLGVFAEFVKKGAIYKGLRPVQWCYTCQTALADAEVEYEEKQSYSIYVAFDVAEDKNAVLPPADKPYSFVIWTTTPWTLPANMGICLGEDIVYTVVPTAEGNYIVAKDLAEEFIESCNLREKNSSLLTLNSSLELSGAKLAGILCKHPLYERNSLVILGDHVKLDAGTGCVHTSPGHGTEDFMVGKAYGLEIFNPTDGRGCFTAAAGKYQGMHIEKANSVIIDDLKESGHLLSEGKLLHQFPHCWRCHKPLMFRATEQWFVSVAKFASDAIAEIERVKWFPPSGQLRMSNMIKDREDWCISRQRAWGVPLPIFYCKNCGKELLTNESVQAVQRLFAEQGSNAWYTVEAEDILQDGFNCSCGCHSFTKEKDIMDVWFDAGSSHAAVLKTRPDLKWPAEVYLEGSDQYRGWFQSSLWTGDIAEGRAPFDNIVACGFVVDGEGRKMSKSLGNYIEPHEVIEPYGADILRLWAFASDFKSADIRISKAILTQISDAYRKIRNTVRFMLSNLYDYDPNTASPKPDDLNLLDRMMLNRLYEHHAKVTAAYEVYEYHLVYHNIYNFCTVDLSAFYLDILKDRLYASHAESKERKAAQYVLWQFAYCLITELTPVLNFTSEAMYAHLPKDHDMDAVAAILLDWAELPNCLEDAALGELYERVNIIRDAVNKIVEQARSAKVIGSNLDAHIELWADGELLQFLQTYKPHLPEWLIASKVAITEISDIMPETAVQAELQNLFVRVTAAPGEKCPRCWTYSEEASAEGLCPRCEAVVKA